MTARMSEAEGKALIAKMGSRVTASKTVGEALRDIAAKIPAKAVNRNAMQKRSKEDRYKSDVEREYALCLHGDMHDGLTDIVRWGYEPIGLRLPDWGIFWPDFAVWYPDESLEFREIKGRGKYALTDKAKAKFLDARRLFPSFTFRMIQRTADGWKDIL